MDNRELQLPYYMKNPLPEENKEEKNPFKDKEYLRQIYSKELKQYLLIINQLLDRLDYKESYLYDEYPDYLTLERLIDTVVKQLPLEKYVTRENQRNMVKILLIEEISQRRSLK